jgi:hypothetical protein
MLQSHLSAFYLQRFVKTITAILVITIGLLTFNNAVAFDRFYIIVLVGIGLILRQDKNLLTALFIVIVGRLFEEAVWLLDDSKPMVKWTTYAAALFVFYRLRYDKLAKFSLSILLCVLLAEMYWLTTGYERTPRIAFYVAVLIEDLTIRHFIFIRPSSFGNWSRYLRRISLDWPLQNLATLFAILVSLQLIEYFIRHIMQVQSLTIHTIYPSASRILNCTMLWFIIDYAIKKTITFKA